MRDPERLDLPSASSFEIIVACPGQPNLTTQLPDNVVDVVDELAEVGVRIHAARETSSTTELDADEVDIYKSGLDYEQKLLGQWIQDRGIVKYEEGPRELRLWLHDDNAERVTSAKLDVHYLGWDIDGKLHILICDWKTGWSWKLTPSQRNWQLRLQGVLIWREYNEVQSIRVGFVKPIATTDRLDFTDYTESDLTRSQEAIFQHLWLSKLPDAPRIPGNHCNYCQCKAICREAAAFALLPSVIDSRAVITSKDDVEAFVQQMSPKDLTRVHLRASVIGKILDSVKARLKTFTPDQLREIGLVPVPGRRLDPIVKTEEAFAWLKEFGISESELWTALKFSKGELVDALRRDQGWGKDQASGFVGGKLEVFIEKKNAEDSIGSL